MGPSGVILQGILLISNGSLLSGYWSKAKEPMAMVRAKARL